MTPIFAGLDSPEFSGAFNKAAGLIDTLAAEIEKTGAEVRQPAELFDEIAGRLNEAEQMMITLEAYVHAFVSTEADNELAQNRESEIQAERTRLTQLVTKLVAWIGKLEPETLIGASETARLHAFWLRRAKIAAGHLMAPAAEELAAALSVSGTQAWAKLHGAITARLTAKVTVDGTTEDVPMSLVRAMAHDPSAAKRKAAYKAELAAWQTVEAPVAFALNSIKGEVNTTSAGRGWPDALAACLFENNTDLETLDAMQQAVTEALPDFRRYLRAKARLLTGSDRLAWFDLYAPVVSEGENKWSYDRASGFVIRCFEQFSPELGDLAKRAVKERWIDAEPRAKKQQGGYCISVQGDQSRIFMNYDDSFDSLQTLAHELGHAYHNLKLASRPPLLRETPMALAETASTFCQAIVFNAALSEASPGQQMSMLQSSLADACGYVVDIHSRFLFEKSVFEARRRRELTTSELKELMLDAQLKTYGDALDPKALHPYMWAAKVHYYLPGLSYYNWPYTFGMLFSFALYSRYLEDPAGFVPAYNELLSSTGMATPAELAARFGMDVASPGFWRASLAAAVEKINRFEALASPAPPV